MTKTKISDVFLWVSGQSTNRTKLDLLGGGTQVAPHASGTSGRFINEKLTEEPHFTVHD